jgi:hypothetical protein
VLASEAANENWVLGLGSEVWRKIGAYLFYLDEKHVMNI